MVELKGRVLVGDKPLVYTQLKLLCETFGLPYYRVHNAVTTKGVAYNDDEKQLRVVRLYTESGRMFTTHKGIALKNNNKKWVFDDDDGKTHKYKFLSDALEMIDFLNLSSKS